MEISDEMKILIAILKLKELKKMFREIIITLNKHLKEIGGYKDSYHNYRKDKDYLDLRDNAVAIYRQIQECEITIFDHCYFVPYFDIAQFNEDNKYIFSKDDKNYITFKVT